MRGPDFVRRRAELSVAGAWAGFLGKVRRGEAAGLRTEESENAARRHVENRWDGPETQAVFFPAKKVGAALYSSERVVKRGLSCPIRMCGGRCDCGGVGKRNFGRFFLRNLEKPGQAFCHTHTLSPCCCGGGAAQAAVAQLRVVRLLELTGYVQGLNLPPSYIGGASRRRQLWGRPLQPLSRRRLPRTSSMERRHR